MQPAQNTPRKRGCWFYGCVSLVILGLLGGILVFLLARYTVKEVNRIKEDYTDTQPVPIEQVEIAPAELTNLQQRVDAFKTALDQQRNATELVLTDRDINALISHDPDFKDLKGKVYVTIVGDQVKGKVSMPLPDIGPVKLKGRYLNGETTLRVSLQNGRLQVNLDEVEVNGKPLPAPLMSELRNKNFAEDATRDPKNAEAIAKFDSIVVQDGKIILRSKGQ